MTEDEIKEKLSQYHDIAMKISKKILQSTDNYKTYEKELAEASTMLDELIVDSAIGLLKYRLSIGMER